MRKLARASAWRVGDVATAWSKRSRGWTIEALLQWFARQREIETEARTGFFLTPAALMVGISLVYQTGLRPPDASAFTAAAAFVLLASWSWGRSRAGPALIAAALLCLGAGLADHELDRVRTTTFSGEATVRIEGTVAWRDEDARDRLRYVVDIESTDRPRLSRPPERARILVSSRHEPIGIGERYEGLVRLRAPSGPAFPGSYDFAFASHFAGLGAYGFGLGAPDPAPQDRIDPAPTAGQRLAMLRLHIGERIRAVIGGPEGAVAAALINGDRAGIPDEIDEWLRATGLSHVLSISGLHMALVAGFAMAVVRGGLAAVPWCALVLPVKKIAALAAFAVATFYLLIAGSNVATDRSYIMLSIMLLAVLFDRPALTLRNVGLAAIVVLALSPHALTTASFQMSFAATAALVGVYGSYARWKATRGAVPTARSPIVGALVLVAALGLSSVVAGAATGPYAAYHFQRIAPFGLVANMLALPIFSFWIMPLALISMVMMPFGLDAPFLVLMGEGLGVVFEIARVLAGILPDPPTGKIAVAGLLVMTLAILVACFLSSGLRWSAVPLAALGLVLAPDRSPAPELLVFEDGKEVALIDRSGALAALRPRPNDFVFSQWQRAFPPPASATPTPATGFACVPIPPDPRPEAPGAGSATDRMTDASAPPPAAGRTGAGRRMQFCTAQTRSGLKVVWTDDWRLVGRACDEADVAIVARAIRLDACRSGALLVTLRSLRRSGSLAISRERDTGGPVATASIGEEPETWNVHRLAPWPEFWRQPVEEGTGTASEPVPAFTQTSPEMPPISPEAGP